MSADLIPGVRNQLEGNAGGVITACERLSHFTLTWEFAEGVSWVEVRVSDDGDGRARLALTPTSLLLEHSGEYGPGPTGVGWELGLKGLAIHLAQQNEPIPDEAAFAMSPNGKAFIAGSSEGWAQAAVAAGDDPGATRAAAMPTSPLYTG